MLSNRDRTAHPYPYPSDATLRAPYNGLPGTHDPYASTPSINKSFLGTPQIALSEMPSNPYGNLDNNTPIYSSSQWFEQQQTSKRRAKIIVLSSVFALLILIGAGATVGILLSRHNSSSSISSHRSSSKGGSSSTGFAVGPYGIVKQTDSSDPSTFIPDSSLKQSFYGIAYTPAKSQLPDCGNSLAAVIEDIQLMSQLTSRVRLYGADCNQSALVLEAVRQTRVNVSVWLADYNVATNGTAYTEQRNTILQAVETYGPDGMIGGVTVGNEFILDYLGANEGGEDPNGPVGDQGAAILISNITNMRTQLTNIGYGHIPVGTSDAGAYFNTEVLEAVDYGMSNIHPWFANQSVANAAGWTWVFFQETNVYQANQVSNKPTMYIGETGWPTSSTDASNESNGPSNASMPNLQTYLEDFVCGSNKNGTQYFYFEFADEEWQKIRFGGVEGSWGLFYDNRTIKDVTIPDCTSS